LENDLEQINIKEDIVRTENPNSDNEEENVYDESNDMNRTFIEKIVQEQNKQNININIRPQRERKKPEWLQSYVHLAMSAQNFVDNVPKTNNEAINSENKNKWIEAMNSEIKSLSDNGTWTLVNTPNVCKPVSYG